MKLKKTKSLVASLIAIVICFSMLLGTTYAWFTDSIVNTNNIIKSGNVDVELYHKSNSDTDYSEVDGTTKLFVNANGGDILWEPGAKAIETFKIENAGSLALKYAFRIKAVSKTTNSNGQSLADILTLTVTGGENVNQTAIFGKGIDVEANLASADFDEYTVSINWNLETLDENGDVIENKPFENLKLLLGIELVATQVASEFDGTGNTFDSTAQFPNVSSNVKFDELTSGEEVVLETKGENAVSAKLTSALVEALKDKGIDSISLVHTDPIVENDKIVFESIEVVDKNGNVVDLEALNLTEKVTVTLPAQETFAPATNVSIFHNNTFVTFATVAEDGTIAYDVKHFCEVEVASSSSVKWSDLADTTWYNDTDKEFELDSAEKLAGLAQLVVSGNTFKIKTIKLAKNIDLRNAQWTPIGNSSYSFQGTFDGQEHIIKNLNCVMEGKSNVGLFGMTTNGEIKNLTVENAIVTGRLCVGVVAGTPYTSKYTNIKVVGHVEVNGMSYVGTVGGKNAYANWTNVTVDVDETSYVKANSVENGIAYRTYVGGVIGFMGEGGHKFENVKSNIDVIGSTCDVGGITGIAHYGNSFINCSSSGDVTITDASEEADAEEIGGIAGVWHNGGADVTFENCTFTGKLSTNVSGVNLEDNTITGKAYLSTGDGNLIIK